MNLRKKSTHEEFERALARCKPGDFDDHTEFYRLTPEQRLEWLCQAAAFVHEFKRQSAPGCETRNVERFRIYFLALELIEPTVELPEVTKRLLTSFESAVPP
jgi:hypothetical protein